VLQSVAVCCSLFKSVAVFSSLLQSVQVCCSLFKSVAACCLSRAVDTATKTLTHTLFVFIFPPHVRVSIYIYILVYVYIYIYMYTNVYKHAYKLMCVLGGHLFIRRPYLTHRCTLSPLTHTATHCNSLQHTATHRCTSASLMHTATRYNTLHHTATLQHTATHCNTLQHTAAHRCTSAPLTTHAQVYLGATPCARTLYMTDSKLVCVTPAGGGAAVSASVEVSNQHGPLLPSAFGYIQLYI